MKYPCLVRKCSTDIKVVIYGEGTSRTGGPVTLLSADLKCDYQDTSKVILDKFKKETVINGVAYFKGDIAPSVPEISNGKCEVLGMKRDIARGTKARNPDGTVNHTKLELM